jgi:serine protease Do
MALAEIPDSDEGEAPAPPPDRSQAGLKKLQDAVAKAQADLQKAQQEKAAAEKAQKAAGKDKADKAGKDKNAKKEPTPEERAQRGVVVIERGGQTLGLGAVLAGDGRILTALSLLGTANDLDARFADGTTVRVKLGHHDRQWDLAFLVPQTGKWPDGLTASSRDPVRQDATIRSYSLARGKLNAAPMTLRGYRGLIGGDDKPLDRVIEIGSRVTPTDLGSPVVDEEGRVVAVIGRGCAPNEGRPCTPVAFGIPMSAIKTFLRSVPPTAVAPSPWLGIQGVSEPGGVAKGVRVTVVHPESPAEEAKLKGGERAAGDIILAVDGVPVTTPEALADAVKTHAVGEKVPLTLLSDGKYKQVTVHLRAPGTRLSASSKDANPAELPALQDSTPTQHRVGGPGVGGPGKLPPRRP